MEPQQTTAASRVGTIADLNRVTTFSKYFALLLFVALPIIGVYVGFSMGMAYQQKLTAAADGQAMSLVLGELKRHSAETVLPPVADVLSGDIAVVRDAIAPVLGVGPDEVTVLAYTEKVWSDGCLGLGAADELCAQAEVPGFYLEVAADGGPRAFRTDRAGGVVREEVVPSETEQMPAAEEVEAAP